MLPDGFTSGKIKCPKCGQILAIQAPAAPVAPAPTAAIVPETPAPNVPNQTFPAPADPFDDPFAALPNLPAASVPAASAPTGSVSQYRPPPARQAPAKKQKKAKPAKKKKSSGGAGAILTIGGSILGVMFILCSGIGVMSSLGLIGASHSGWKQVSFHGYQVNMPGKGPQAKKTDFVEGITTNELIFRRNESGAQYGIVVAKVPSFPGAGELSIAGIKENLRPMMSGVKDIDRSGVKGISGRLERGFKEIIGARVEVFAHKGEMLILSYLPYSLIKGRLKERKRPVRKNEKELDKPDEFFSSIKFR